jgi:hypothetical protein
VEGITPIIRGPVCNNFGEDMQFFGSRGLSNS